MTSEETIFADALAITGAQERSDFLNRSCGGDDELRARIEVLLSAHERAGAFLESPAIGSGGSGDTVAIAPRAERAGTMVGPYKLLEQIGEGGMGVVFMAEQVHPVRRRVALKIIKPGMDTKQVIARFEAERQALAMMDHPNIAKVLEAGATDAGRPYFVMELVRGLPITEYCDQQKLAPRPRLELFVQVCQAVQHAHQKGIIHRDLKPSNVLIAVADDGRPVPKVIDFGIAKATIGQRLTEQTLFTEFRQLVGTPLYMSPEQAQTSALQDVDTRSDVYSLGVLLYELLTGTTPFDKQRLGKAAHDEIRRIIREEEPPRPSTRISTLGETLTTVSAQRQTDPGRLGAIVRGDLDWIVMRAMEKDRRRRYETAIGFAQDVERYLADEPVEASPPSATYRLRKFMHRHRAATVTLGSFAGVLILATVVSNWQAVRATRAKAAAVAAELRASKERDEAQVQKRRADQQAAIAQAVNDFLANMLGAPAPWAGMSQDVTVLQATRSAIEQLDGGALDGQPLIEAAVRQTIGSTLNHIGHADEAEPELRAALALRRAVLPPGHLDIAQTLVELGGVLTALNKTDEAETLLREALGIYRQNLPQRERDYSYNLTNLGTLLRNIEVHHPVHQRDLRKLAEAAQFDREALQIRRRLFPDGSNDVAHALISVGYDLASDGKPAEAEAAFREAVAIERKTASPGLPGTIKVLADHLRKGGKTEEAKALLEEIAATTGGDESLARATLLQTQARMLEQNGKLSDAETLYRQVMLLRLKDLPPADWHAGGSLAVLAAVLKAQGKTEQVVQLYEQYGKPFYDEAIKKRKAEGDTREVILALVDVGHVLASADRFVEAETIYRDVLQMRRNLYPEQSYQITASLTRLTRVLRARGQRADADALWLQSVEIRQRAMAEKAPEFQAGAYLIVIPAMLGCGQVEQAKGFCRTALAMKAVNPDLLNDVAWLFATADPPHQDSELAVKLAERSVQVAPASANAHNTLGVAYYRVGRFKEAIAELEISAKGRSKVEFSDVLFLAMAHARLGDRQAARELYAKLDLANLKLTQNGELRRFLKEAEDVIGAGGQPH